MSLAETTIIILVGLFVLKPEDLKQIARSVKNLINYVNKLKQEIFDSIQEDDEKDQDKINNYLARIVQISGKYEGEYDLASVKAYYHKLLIEKHSKEIDQ